MNELEQRMVDAMQSAYQRSLTLQAEAYRKSEERAEKTLELMHDVRDLLIEIKVALAGVRQ